MTSLGVVQFGFFAGEIGNANRTFLGPNAYHGRVPLYMTLGSNSISGNEDNQLSNDLQFAAMVAGGIDYVAFIVTGSDPNYNIYGDTTGSPWGGFNSAFSYYLTSAYKSRLKFCLVVGSDSGYPAIYSPPANPYATANWTAVVNHLVTRMAEPQHMRVMGGRPLVLFLFPDNFIATTAGGNPSTAASLINQINTSAASAGFNPYIVGLDSDSGPGNAAYTSSIVHAWGTYNPYEGGGANPYSAHVTLLEGRWATALGNGIKIVPCVNSAGTDWSPSGAMGGLAASYIPPGAGEASPPSSPIAAGTLAQWTAHLTAGFTFRAAHPTNCESDTVLISYGWNEFLEGAQGMVCPHWGDLGSFLQLGVAQNLGKQREPNRSAYRSRSIQMKSR